MQNPDTDAPKSTRKRLAVYGGLNPFHKPMWRVCLAQHVLIKRGGIFHQWPTGELEMFTVGAKGEVHYEALRPNSVKCGIMEVPKYPCQGWILERWMPAHLYGSRESWESQKAEDGTPMMGPYPHEGRYWMIAGPFEKIPELSDLECAVAQYEQQMSNRPVNLEAAMRKCIKEEEDALDAQREKLVAELEHYRKSEILPVLKGTSLSAQGIRNHLQKMVGETSHLGVI